MGLMDVFKANENKQLDEHLQELTKMYSRLSTRKKAELVIWVDDFVKGVENNS